jgi:TP901 family phage tail tape measure protein
MAEIVSQYRIEVNGAVTNLNKMADATDASAKKGEELGKKTEQAGQQATKASKIFANLGKQILAAFGLVGVVTTFISAIKNAIQVSANFEKQMSTVRAITGATADEMNQLDKSARQLGASTRYTATQVGQLQEEFGRLGFTTKEILAATEATLNLATATGSTLAEAAEVAGSTVRGFQLDASETVRVTDVMALSFSKSALNMERFRESMKLIAPIATAANIPLETVTAMLGQLSNAGLSGSIAGTALKNLLSKLSDENSSLSKTLGMSVKNSEDLYAAFEKLKTANIDLTEATELTDERSKAAFLTLISGIDSVKGLDEALKGAAGSTKEMADIMEANMEGALTRLSSAYEGFILQLNESNGLLAASFDGLANGINKATQAMKTSEGSSFRAVDLFLSMLVGTDMLAEAQEKAAKKTAELAKQRLADNEAIQQALGQSVEQEEAVKSEIRNIYFLTNAIKLLKEEAEREGTTRERIREILKLIIPLETELAELLGKETEAMKKLREETEKATKAEEDRLAALDKASDEKLKKRLAVDAFIAERTAMGLKEEMDAAILAEQQKAMLMEADALNVGLSQDKIEAIRQASIDEQLRIQNEYGTKIQEIEDAGVKAVQDAEEEKKKARKKAQEQAIEDFSTYAGYTLQLIGQVSQAQQAATDAELAQLQNALDAGQITREEYDKERRELLNEQARQDKELSVFEATVAAFLATIKAYSDGGPIAAAIAAAFGVVQVALIASQPVPQFEKGGEVRGKRHAQGGTLIEAEDGEFVVNRSATAKNMALIEAINKGVEDAYIMRKWVAPAVDSALLNGWQDVGKSAELNNITANLRDHNIIAAMDRNRQATTYGLKLLADKLDKRAPKRGGYA